MISTGFKRLSVVATAATCIALAASDPAQAFQVFNDRSAFEAASTGLTNIDFEGIVTPDSYDGAFGGGTFSGVTISDVQNFLYIVDRPPGVSFDNGTGAILGTGTFPNVIIATLPGGITAIGTDLLPYGPVSYLVRLSSGVSRRVDVDSEGKAFVGFTSDTPIEFISFESITTDFSSGSGHDYRQHHLRASAVD